MTSSARDIWDRALECLIRRPPAAERVDVISTSTIDTPPDTFSYEHVRSLYQATSRDAYYRGAADAFRIALRAGPRNPPRLERIVAHRDDYSQRIEFHAFFSDGRRIAWRIDENVLYPEVLWFEHYQRLLPTWENMCSRHTLDFDLRERRRSFNAMVALNVDPNRLAHEYGRLRDDENSIRAQHAPPLRFPNHAVDPTINMRPGGITYVDGNLDNYRYVEVYGFTPGLSARELHGGFRDYEQIEAANQKALKLLQEWLTPEQAAQYKEHNHFEVIGCDTGKRYRICQGRQQNVYELGADGKPKQGYCFTPEGSLAEGDAMLAQKIALETFERAALKKANLYHAYDGVAQYVSMGQAALRERVWLAGDWIGS